MLKNVHWGESKKGLKSFDSISLNTASSKAINQAFPYFTTWPPKAERAAVRHQWGRNHNRRGSGVTFTTFREEKYNAHFQHGARRLWQEWDDQQGDGSSVGDGGSLRGGHGDRGHRRACRRLHPCSKSPLGSPRMGARHHNALWPCRYCYPWQVKSLLNLKLSPLNMVRMRSCRENIAPNPLVQGLKHLASLDGASAWWFAKVDKITTETFLHICTFCGFKGRWDHPSTIN